MTEKHPGNHYKNQENFQKVSAIFFNTKNLPKKFTKNPLIYSDFFLEISQNHPEIISRFRYSSFAMFSIRP